MMNRGEENSETIPLDLIIEILTRLPARSIARFRCISKLWNSTLVSPIFTDSFLTISSSRPKLLFTFLLGGKTFFFSSPQTQNSSTLTAKFHMTFPINCPLEIGCPVRGLLCGLNRRTVNRETVIVPLICNPSIGKFLILPNVNTSYERVRSFVDYNPIQKQFKVLCMSTSRGGVFKEYQVLTLGGRKELSWRMVECDIHHNINNDEWICINGVLYYLALVRGFDTLIVNIVCFEIRSEKFKCIRLAQDMPEEFIRSALVVNYKGKLAMLKHKIVFSPIRSVFQLWVLEDAETHQWTSYNYVVPLPWMNIFEANKLYSVGTTSRGEIVLAPNSMSYAFYLFYCNPETKSTRRVEIQGMEAFKAQKAYIFLDHVENMKLMDSL